MKSNSILFSEKKKLVKYNPSKYSSEWELDFEYNVYGISRIDNFVFVTTYSNWGKIYTSLVEFDTGKKLWTLKEIFYTVHIIGDKIIYKDKKKYFNGIDINTGKKIFNSKPPYIRHSRATDRTVIQGPALSLSLPENGAPSPCLPRGS